MPTFELLFEEPTEEWPNPRAWVRLSVRTESADGTVLLTPEAVSLRELEAQIDLLRSDLNDVLAEAKRRFVPVDGDKDR